MLQFWSSTLVADPIAAQSSVVGLLSRFPENPDGTDATEWLGGLWSLLLAHLGLAILKVSTYIEVAQGDIFMEQKIWFVQRVIRREPKIECYVLTKVKNPPFFRSFYDNF